MNKAVTQSRMAWNGGGQARMMEKEIQCLPSQHTLLVMTPLSLGCKGSCPTNRQKEKRSSSWLRGEAGGS